ncbi:unnamed protein product [Aphanomyces euteiches]
MIEAENDILLENLPLVIATDEELTDDFAFVCKLLEDSTSDLSEETSSTTSDEGPKEQQLDSTTLAKTKSKRGNQAVEYPSVGARNRFQYRQKQEMHQLRQQIEELKNTLTNVTHLSKPHTNASTWEQAARKERIECKRVLEENEQLRGAIDQQATFIDQMQRFFSKKPRLTMLSEEEMWQSYKLAAKKSLRIAAIHAIADRQLRRMQSAMIQIGVFNSKDDIFMAEPRATSPTSLVIDFVNHVKIPAPYRTISASCWQVMSETNDPFLPANATESAELIDPFTIYRQFTQPAGGIVAHSNTIRRYYTEDNRDVILWRTVLEDALVPHMARGAVDNEWGWLLFAPEPDEPMFSRVTFLHQVLVDNAKPVHNGIAVKIAIQQAIRNYRLCERPDVPYKFSCAPPNEMDTKCDPIMHAYMGKGKRLELAISAAIENAVLVSQTQSHIQH